MRETARKCALSQDQVIPSVEEPHPLENRGENGAICKFKRTRVIRIEFLWQCNWVEVDRCRLHLLEIEILGQLTFCQEPRKASNRIRR